MEIKAVKIASAYSSNKILMTLTSLAKE